MAEFNPDYKCKPDCVAHDVMCEWLNTPETAIAHHTAEIAKRDRAIEVLMKRLQIAHIKEDYPETIKRHKAAIEEAQAILGEHVKKSAKT